MSDIGQYRLKSAKHGQRVDTTRCLGQQIDKIKIGETSNQQREKTWMLVGNSEVTSRIACPDDESSMSDFYKTLSENSIYLRWGNRPDEAHVQDLKEACSPGKDKETTLIVRDKQNEVIGVGQLVQFTEEKTELALVVSDHLQRNGLGNKLMDELIQLARDKELKTLILHIDQNNAGMLKLAQKFKFKHRGKDKDSEYLIAELKL